MIVNKDRRFTTTDADDVSLPYVVDVAVKTAVPIFFYGRSVASMLQVWGLDNSPPPCYLCSVASLTEYVELLSHFESQLFYVVLYFVAYDEEQAILVLGFAGPHNCFRESGDDVRLCL